MTLNARLSPRTAVQVIFLMTIVVALPVSDAVTIGANVDVTLTSDPNNRQQVEPTIAVHPTKPNIIVAGAQDLRLVAQGKDRWHGYYRSEDGGQTWSVRLLPGFPGDTFPEGLASPLRAFDFTSDPVLAIDRMGNVFFVGVAAKSDHFGNPIFSSVRTFVARFIDDGATYHSATLLDSPGLFGTNHDKPWIAVDNSGGPNDGNVYLVYDAMVRGVFSSVFVRSTDHGMTFSRVRRVPSSTTGFLPFVTVGPEGNIYVSSLDASLTNVQVSKSVDAGLTFTTVIAASGISFLPSPLPFNSFRTFTIPQMAADTGGVFLVWDDFRTGDSDVLFSKSPDGIAWSIPVRVNDVTTNHQFFPAISVSGSKVSIAFYDSRNDDGLTIECLDTYFTESTDGGQSFLQNVRLTTQCFNPNIVPRTVQPAAGFPFMGDYIDIDSTSTEAHVIWADNRNVNLSADENTGRLDQDILTVKITL